MEDEYWRDSKCDVIKCPNCEQRIIHSEEDKVLVSKEYLIYLLSTIDYKTWLENKDLLDTMKFRKDEIVKELREALK